MLLETGFHDLAQTGLKLKSSSSLLSAGLVCVTPGRITVLSVEVKNLIVEKFPLPKLTEFFGDEVSFPTQAFCLWIPDSPRL